jgi:hypothetical protein
LLRREKLFWLCAGAAFVVLFFALIPSHYEICEVAEKTKEEHCTPYQVVPFVGIKIAQVLDKAGGIITALATIAIAIFTLTLKRATDRLWDAGEKQLSHLSDTAERQLRAYVTLIDEQVELVANETAFILDFKLRNDGNTPAYHFAAWTEGEVSAVDADPFPDKRPVLGDKAQRSIIGPAAIARTNTSEQPLSATDLEAIRKGTHAIFVWGGAEYEDAFKNPRYFVFRVSMTGKEIRVGESFEDRKVVHRYGWHFSPHPKGYDGN